MTSLDDLLSAAGRVDEITPGQLGRGRAELEASVAMAGTARQAGTADLNGHRRTSGVPGTEPVTAHSLRTSRSSRVSRSTRPSRYSVRRKFTLGGIAVAACAALITVPVLTNTGGSGAEASAATLLRAAGNAAGKQQGGWPGAAYWDVVSVYKQGSGPLRHREIWISHHGTSVLRDPGVSGPVLALGPGLFPAGGTALTWDELYALPTDPGQLTGVLQADIKGAGPDPQSELFTIVGDLLRESPAPPALRKALFDVAAGIPGVHLTGKVKDALGRTGTGVTRGDETLLVDPADGRLLADTEGTWTATYVYQGVATSAPAPAANPDAAKSASAASS